MKRGLIVGMFALLVLACSGCKLLDALTPEPVEPDCPYPGVVCDLLDDITDQLHDQLHE